MSITFNWTGLLYAVLGVGGFMCTIALIGLRSMLLEQKQAEEKEQAAVEVQSTK